MEKNNTKLYYEDYRLKIIENEHGNYDVYDEKFGGRLTRRNVSKKWVDDFIQSVLSKRRKHQNRKEGFYGKNYYHKSW